MPERGFESLNYEPLQPQYVPGYDWMPGRFGPPPGIPKARKDEFDRMTDREYFHAFRELSQEEKESLMASEVERRRTFAAHWPIESIVKSYDCAKEGFYYTGAVDRVQCAFCGGIIRNWERGDVPRNQHRRFFSHCKMVHNEPCHNIPAGNVQFSHHILTGHWSEDAAGNGRFVNCHDSSDNPVPPRAAVLSELSKRRHTFNNYPACNVIPAEKLWDAGFSYEGVLDKVKCFHCDGELEKWIKGNDPWTEHAKWYPGCVYVQQIKGLNFIRTVRSQMTPAELETANKLTYNKADVSFLDSPAVAELMVHPVERLEGFKLCVSLGYDRELVRMAYHANADAEYEDQTKLVGIVQDLAEGVRTSLEEYEKSVEKKRETVKTIAPSNSSAKPTRTINVPELVTNRKDPTVDECRDLVNAIRCKRCRNCVAGAVVLPCGCFCLCADCSKGRLPRKCPACNSVVRAACRTFLC